MQLLNTKRGRTRRSDVKELQPANKYTVHCSQGWGNQQGRTGCTDAHEIAMSGFIDDAHEVAMWEPCFLRG